MEKVSIIPLIWFIEVFFNFIWSLLCTIEKISSLNASTNPSLIISFLLKFISKGVDISISFIENVFAWLFPVEKKIFIKARNKKKLYKSFKLDKNSNAQEISEKLSMLAAEKILDDIDDILEDKAKFVEQDHSKATYAKKINKKEGQIDWRMGGSKIIGKINGLFPSPGAFFSFNGERYKILKAKIGNGVGKVGEVVSDNLEVACGNNQTIKILEIQRQGKNPQKISEFMLGSRIKIGSIIPNV